jgi:hypothetical protein
MRLVSKRFQAQGLVMRYLEVPVFQLDYINVIAAGVVSQAGSVELTATLIVTVSRHQGLSGRHRPVSRRN